MKHLKTFRLFENSSLYKEISINDYYRYDGVVPINQSQIDEIEKLIQEKFECVIIRPTNPLLLVHQLNEYEKYINISTLYLDLYIYKDYDEWYYVFLYSYDPFDGDYETAYKCDDFIGLLEFLKKEISRIKQIISVI